MAYNDVKVKRHPGYRRSVRTNDRDTSGFSRAFRYGEPIKRGGAGGNFAILILDGDPELGTDIFLGIVQKDGTETATADGIAEYASLVSGTVLEAAATTAANVDLDSELLLLEGDYVGFDYAASVFTIDEDQGDNPDVNGLKILTGDVNAQTLQVLVHLLCTENASAVGTLGQTGT